MRVGNSSTNIAASGPYVIVPADISRIVMKIAIGRFTPAGSAFAA